MRDTAVLLELATQIRTTVINGHAPVDVINVLYKAELWFLDRMKPECMNKFDLEEILAAMDIENICTHVRHYVWQGIVLPQGFPIGLNGIMSPYLSQIGFVVENTANLLEVQQWITGQLQGIFIKFINPAEFGGAAFVPILPIDSIEPEYAKLLREERSAR